MVVSAWAEHLVVPAALLGVYDAPLRFVELEQKVLQIILRVRLPVPAALAREGSSYPLETAGVTPHPRGLLRAHPLTPADPLHSGAHQRVRSHSSLIVGES